MKIGCLDESKFSNISLIEQKSKESKTKNGRAYKLIDESKNEEDQKLNILHLLPFSENTDTSEQIVNIVI